MASTRSIRKRALKKVRDGRRLQWVIADITKMLATMHVERLQAVCSLPESVVAALRSVDACRLSDAEADRLIAQIREGEAVAPRGVTIPPGSALSVQVGDSWQVLSGPQSGCLVPMTEDEKVIARSGVRA